MTAIEKHAKLARWLFVGAVLFLSIPTFSLYAGDGDERAQKVLGDIAKFGQPGENLPADVAANAKTLQFLFVKGFGQERYPEYFDKNIEALEGQGVPADHFHKFGPDSQDSIHRNSFRVEKEILSLIRSHPDQKLVVVAHSKGAAETLVAILRIADRDPDLVKDHVARVALLNPPLKGTPWANLLLSHRTPLKMAGASFHDRVRAQKENLFFRLVQLFKPRLLRGLRSLGVDWASPYMAKQLARSESARRVLDPLVITFRSYVPRPEDHRSYGGRYLHRNVGLNDDYLPLDSQAAFGLPGIEVTMPGFHSHYAQVVPTFPEPNHPEWRGSMLALVSSIPMSGTGTEVAGCAELRQLGR